MPAAGIAGAATAGVERRRRVPDRQLEVQAQLAPLAGAFLAATAGGLQALLLPLRAQLEGVPAAAIGGLAAAVARPVGPRSGRRHRQPGGSGQRSEG